MNTLLENPPPIHSETAMAMPHAAGRLGHQPDSKIQAAVKEADESEGKLKRYAALSLYQIIIAGQMLAEKRCQLEDDSGATVVLTVPPSERFSMWMDACFPSSNDDERKNRLRKARTWMNAASYVMKVILDKWLYPEDIPTKLKWSTSGMLLSEALTASREGSEAVVINFQDNVLSYLFGTTLTKLVRAANGKCEGGDNSKRNDRDYPKHIGRALTVLSHHLSVKYKNQSRKDRKIHSLQEHGIIASFEIFVLKCPRWLLVKLQLLVDRELKKTEEDRARRRI